MKPWQIITLLFVFLCGNALAQSYQKNGSLFKHTAKVIPVDTAVLAHAFDLQASEPLSIDLPGFYFEGFVTANIRRSTELQSLIAKSPQLNNTLFSVSRHTQGDSVFYSGRIVHLLVHTGYRLVYKQSKLVLEKIDTSNLLEDRL